MKQADSLKRIEMPNENENNEYVDYTNQLKPQFDCESEYLKVLYFRHEL